MPYCHRKMCGKPLHADDTHAEYVSCLGKSHADAALSGADCSHCERFSLASLRSRLAFFSESNSAPCALPFSFSQGSVRKKQRAEDFSGWWQVSSRWHNARVPRRHYRERALLRSEMGHFLDFVSRPRLRRGHLRCVKGSFISAGDAG